MYSTPDLTQEQRIRDAEFSGIIENEMDFDLFVEAIGERAASEKTVILEMLADASRELMGELYNRYRRHSIETRVRHMDMGRFVNRAIFDALRDTDNREAYALAMILNIQDLGHLVDWSAEQYIKQIVDSRYPDRLRYQPTEADRAEVAAEWRMEERK